MHMQTYKTLIQIQQNAGLDTVKIVSLFVSIATLYCGFHDAQTRNCGMPEEVQRQEETQGVFHSNTHTHTCSLNFIFTQEVTFPPSPHRGPSSPPCLCHGTSLVSYSGMMKLDINSLNGFDG